MDRDLDLLTALLLDPFLTTDEAVCEAAAHRRVRQGEFVVVDANPRSPGPSDPSRTSPPRRGARAPR